MFKFAAYLRLYKDLTIWCYRTAILQFCIFLGVFLAISYVSTLIVIEKANDGETVFVTEFERYIVLSYSLYMIIPFALSNVLIFGVLHKNDKVLKVFVYGSFVNTAVIFIVGIGSGVFIAIEGSARIAYSIIAVTIVFELLILHGAFLAQGFRDRIANGEDEPAEDLDSSSFGSTEQ